MASTNEFPWYHFFAMLVLPHIIIVIGEWESQSYLAFTLATFLLTLKACLTVVGCLELVILH